MTERIEDGVQTDRGSRKSGKYVTPSVGRAQEGVMLKNEVPIVDGALLTDLYELSMLQTYFERGMNDIAVFEVFIRALPPQRNFLVAAGLEQAIEYLTALRVREEDRDWMHRSGRFTPAFIASLANLRFTGDVPALPEGTVCFPNEPLLQVAAPLREAQLVESRLLNLLHYQTLVASKAARCVQAAWANRSSISAYGGCTERKRHCCRRALDSLTELIL
jgi:nicotinic acid phosphoribosyltransferase